MLKTIKGTNKTSHSLAICLARFLKPIGKTCDDKTPWEKFIEYVINELEDYNYMQSLKWYRKNSKKTLYYIWVLWAK